MLALNPDITAAALIQNGLGTLFLPAFGHQMPDERDEQDERADANDGQEAVPGKIDYKIHFTSRVPLVKQNRDFPKVGT